MVTSTTSKLHYLNDLRKRGVSQEKNSNLKTIFVADDDHHDDEYMNNSQDDQNGHDCGAMIIFSMKS